jgi:hypothetical protein
MAVFDASDTQSGDGMLTTVWGPSFWHVLHTMSFNYPVSPDAATKKSYLEFMRLLPSVLPCKHCRENLKKIFIKAAPKARDMASRDSFSRYVYALHEAVNTNLKKTSGLTFEAVRERYEHFRARCTTTTISVEKGCTEPVYVGEKAKCILKIVPQTQKCATFQMNNRCLKQRVNTRGSPTPGSCKAPTASTRASSRRRRK